MKNYFWIAAGLLSAAACSGDMTIEERDAAVEAVLSDEQLSAEEREARSFEILAEFEGQTVEEYRDSVEREGGAVRERIRESREYQVGRMDSLIRELGDSQ